MESGRHAQGVRVALASATCALALGGVPATALAGSWHARDVALWGASARRGNAGGTAPHRFAGEGRREGRRHDARIGGEGGRRSSRARRSRRSGDRPSTAGFLERCVDGEGSGESYAIFAGEMQTVSGSAQMAMRIDVEERAQGESSFHRVAGNGLGVWRLSEPGVKVFRDVKQVTSLVSPAAYRGLVRFHWLDAEGHVIKRARLLTPVCRQPAPGESRVAGRTPTARML